MCIYALILTLFHTPLHFPLFLILYFLLRYTSFLFLFSIFYFLRSVWRPISTARALHETAFRSILKHRHAAPPSVPRAYRLLDGKRLLVEEGGKIICTESARTKQSPQTRNIASAHQHRQAMLLRG